MNCRYILFKEVFSTIDVFKKLNCYKICSEMVSYGYVFINSKALERKVKISNSNGMHARPATKFAEIANKYSSEIHVKTKNKEVAGKSVIDLLTLGAENGTEIVIYAKGIDAVEALDALEGLVKSKFEEEFMEIRKGIAVSPGVVIREAFCLKVRGTASRAIL